VELGILVLFVSAAITMAAYSLVQLRSGQSKPPERMRRSGRLPLSSHPKLVSRRVP
jgi:hypothetical protein